MHIAQYCIGLVHNSLAVFYNFIGHIREELIILLHYLQQSDNVGVFFRIRACTNRVVLSSSRQSSHVQSTFSSGKEVR